MTYQNVKLYGALNDFSKEIAMRIFNYRKLSAIKAYLLLFVGFHYLYLRKTKLFFLYFFTLGGLGFWFLLSIIKLKHDVKVRNDEIFYDVLMDVFDVNKNISKICYSNWNKFA